MQDRPTVIELLQAVREHLEREVMPALEGAKLKFQTLVAANVLAIVERELAGEERIVDEELARLASLGHGASTAPSHSVAPRATQAERRDSVLALTQELCAAIRRGEWDAPERLAHVTAHVRATVGDKLRVGNPRYKSATASPPRRP